MFLLKMENKLIKKMNFADKVASRSKDNSTKVGAVFYDEDETHPISFGYNGMPRGLNDEHPERNERPEKYLWYEHAERNAIYNAARPILENRIAFISTCPNMESARALVSCGIKKVITDISTINKDNDDYKRIVELFSETGVEFIAVDFISHPKSFSDFLSKMNKESALLSKNDKLIKPLKDLYSKLDKYVYYLSLAKDYAETESFGNYQKSGTLIMDEKNYNPISSGVYGPPANLKLTENIIDNEKLWFQEDVKNAIYNAVRKVLKNSVADVTWCPCQKCALGIVSVQSRKVRTRKPDFTKEADLRWQAEFEKSQEIFQESGTIVEFIKMPLLESYKKPKGGIKL
jgi:dCMP deaminase